MVKEHVGRRGSKQGKPLLGFLASQRFKTRVQICLGGKEFFSLRLSPNNRIFFFHYCKITKDTVQFFFRSSDQCQFKSVGWGFVLLAAFVCCVVRPNI